MSKFGVSTTRLMLSLGAAALLAPLFTHADTTYNGVPSTGTFVASGNFAINPPKHAPIPRFSTKTLPYFTPRKPHAAAVKQGAVPVVDSLSVHNSKSTLLANFNGVSNLDSAIANSGILVEPPDQGLCVGDFLGHRRVFEIVVLSENL